jgi:hypothetical protein
VQDDEGNNERTTEHGSPRLTRIDSPEILIVHLFLHPFGRRPVLVGILRALEPAGNETAIVTHHSNTRVVQDVSIEKTNKPLTEQTLPKKL